MTGAELTVGVWKTPATTGSIEVHPVLEAWNEWEATWNERLTGVSWAALGCGSASRSASLGAFQPYDEIDYVIPVSAALVQSWVSDSSVNFGFVLVPVATTTWISSPTALAQESSLSWPSPTCREGSGRDGPPVGVGVELAVAARALDEDANAHFLAVRAGCGG